MDFELKLLVQPDRASRSALAQDCARERKNETIFKNPW